MVATRPEPTLLPASFAEDDRAPWQRARELLDAGYPWPQIKSCMFIDCLARQTFAEMLGDDDMAALADVYYHHTVTGIENAWISEAEMESRLDALDRRDGLPPFDYEPDGPE